ncbi:MAG TPA: hypothetical protein VMR34_05200 [Candidatus Saccharimonadales bacterium]|nr:hypothetical protein [Candidatus Saccharimonadales bacterium]
MLWVTKIKIRRVKRFVVRSLLIIMRPVARLTKLVFRPLLSYLIRLLKPPFKVTGFVISPFVRWLGSPVRKIGIWLNKIVDRLGRRRVKWAMYSLSVIAVVAIVFGAISYYRSLVSRSYNLPVAVQALIGQPDKSLLPQFSYDTKAHAYYLAKSSIQSLNQSANAAPPTTNSVQVGEGPDEAGYSVKLPNDAHQGITTYDDSSRLSFTLVPEFDLFTGKPVDGHMVYPMDLSSNKDIYSVKRDGLQEDIVFAHAPKGDVKLSYKLELPSTLQARMISGGSIGIYSADPALFGNITYGSPADEQKVEKARQNSAKDNLVFVLPSPTISDNDGFLPAAVQHKAGLSLKGNILTLTASDLGGVNGPVAIDPSVLVTSVNDFQTNGNNDGDITFDGTNNQITESGLSGATLANSSWTDKTTTSTGAMNTAYSAFGSVAYNGYMYAIGTDDTIEYTQIGSTGALSNPGCGGSPDWCSTTAYPSPAISGFGTVVYDGYIYIIGGQTTSAATLESSVFYAPVLSSGALGSWTPTSGLSGGTGLDDLSAVAYNGYIYAVGGCDLANSGSYSSLFCASLGGPDDWPSDAVDTVQSTQINANGSLSSWTSSSNDLANNFADGSAVAYNGYLYALGGCQSYNTGGYGCLPLASSTIQVATINANTIGAWTTLTNSYTTSRVLQTSVVYDGYLYISGGCSVVSNTTPTCTTYQPDTQYAPINSDGTLGTWQTSSSITTARMAASMTSYNSYFYVLGGYTGSNKSDVQYNQVNSAGVIGATWTDKTSLSTGAFNNARQYFGSVAYDGYLYIMGGTGPGACDLSYTGSTQTCNIPSGVSSVTIEIIGAQGGATDTGSSVGAYGGEVQGTISVTPSSTLTIYVGGQGNNPTGGGTGGTGGYGLSKGGAGGNGNTTAKSGGGGGGSSAICSSSSTCTGSILLAEAPGGGGGNYEYSTNAGTGGQTGANGSVTGCGGYGASASAGGIATSSSTCASEVSAGAAGGGPANVAGGKGGGTSSNIAGGGGGGGYYSGGGGANGGAAYTGGGGGGSSFPISGMTYNSGINYPTDSGDGFVSISWTSGYDSDVQYAALNSNGSLSAPSGCSTFAYGNSIWCTTTSFTTARQGLAAVGYNGYMYVMGGYDGTNYDNDVEYAKLTASSGAVGAWTDDTTLAGGAFTTGRESLSAVIYDGYLYIMGGIAANSSGSYCTATGGYCNDVQFAAISSTGALSKPGYCNGGGGSLATGNSIWCITTSFQTARQGFAAVAYNGYMYVTGGYDGTDYDNDVEWDSINSNGSLGAGTWPDKTSTTTGAFSTGREFLSAVAYNGYLYIMGGYNGGSYQNDIQFAAINSGGGVSVPSSCISGNGGTLATSNTVWCTSTSFTTARQGFDAVTYNGYLYIMGGYNGTLQNDVQYDVINNGGPGIINTPKYTFNSSGCYPYGGTCDSGFTQARFGFGAVAYNGYLYIMGGESGSSGNDCNNSGDICSGVQYAQINSNGTIGTWNYTEGSTNNGTGYVSGFTQPRLYFSAVAYNGYLYIMGGLGSSGNDCDVNGYCNGAQYAQINSNGTIGTWNYTEGSTNNGTSYVSGFTQPRVNFAAVAYNGYLYIMGGSSDSSGNDCDVNGYCNGVQYAQINSNGTIGTWNYTSFFAQPRSDFAAVAYNGYLYIMGGLSDSSGNDCSSGDFCNGVQYAQINSNGTIGTWNYTSFFAQARYALSAVAYNGYLYIMGGESGSSGNDCNNSGDICSGVQYSGLQSIPRVGDYSRLIDFTGTSGDDPTPIEMLTDGGDCSSGVCTTNYTNPGLGGLSGPGGIRIQYEFADNACTTFNTSTTLPTGATTFIGVPNPLVLTTDSCSNTTNAARYMWITYLLDDSQTASFPDQASNHTSISDFTVYYHPAAGYRLRGGATFSNGSLNSLDAPP